MSKREGESCMDRWVGGSSKLWLLDMFWLVHWIPEAAATLGSLLFSFCTGRQGTFLRWGGGLAFRGLHPQMHTWPAMQESPRTRPRKRYTRDAGREHEQSPTTQSVVRPAKSADDHCATGLIFKSLPSCSHIFFCYSFEETHRQSFINLQYVSLSVNSI